MADLQALMEAGQGTGRQSERIACENAALRALVVELTTELEKCKAMVASLQVALEKVRKAGAS